MHKVLNYNDLADGLETKVRTRLVDRNTFAAFYVQTPQLPQDYFVSLIQRTRGEPNAEIALVARSVRHPNLFPKISTPGFPPGVDLVEGTQTTVSIPDDPLQWRSIIQSLVASWAPALQRDAGPRAAALVQPMDRLHALMAIPASRGIHAWQVYSCTQEAHMQGFWPVDFIALPHDPRPFQNFPANHPMAREKFVTYLLLQKDSVLYVDARDGWLAGKDNKPSWGLDANSPRLDDMSLPPEVYDRFWRSSEVSVPDTDPMSM